MMLAQNMRDWVRFPNKAYHILDPLLHKGVSNFKV